MFRSVGTKTPLSGMGRAGRWQAEPRTSPSLGIDVPMLLIIITLVIFGLVMVYSASYDYSLSYYGDANRIFQRQIIWLFVGGSGALLATLIDYHKYSRAIVWMMFGAVAMLVLVLIGNEVRNNAVRTLIGGSGQPSEFAKLVIIVYLAFWLEAKRDLLGDFSFGLAPFSVLLGVFGGLIFLQPDLSAVITIFFLGGVMFFLAGGELRQIILLLLVGAVIGFVIVQFHATGSARIANFIAGFKDPTQGSYHVRRALESFVSGGWLGKGIGNAETKVTGLPFPHTDSIFAVVGEETGVIGATVLVLLYLLLLWRGLKIASRAPDSLGALLAGGLSLWLAAEAFVNMAVMVNLMPFAGNALPFLSAGGSNMIVSLVAVGILMNISRRSIQGQAESEKPFRAVVDLRRRDGRRRVSRSNRLDGTGEE